MKRDNVIRNLGILLILAGIILTLFFAASFALNAISTVELEDYGYDTTEEDKNLTRNFYLALGSLFCMVPVGALAFVWGYRGIKLAKNSK